MTLRLTRHIALPLAVFAVPAVLVAQTTTPEMPGTPPEVPGAPAPGEAQPTQPGPPAIPVPPEDPTRPMPQPETPNTPLPSETPMPSSPMPGTPTDPTMQHRHMPGGAMGTPDGMGQTMADPPMGGVRWGPRLDVPAPAPQASYPPCTATRQDQCLQTSRTPKHRRARPR